MPYTSSVDTAKTIRKDLKAAFPGIKFWVASKNSINVSWVDGPTTKAVNAVVMPFEKVSYCEASGEVLSGGNTYVFTERKYSEAALNHGIQLEAKKNRTLWNAVNFEEVELKLDFSERGYDIAWKPEYTTFEYGRVDLSSEVYENLKAIDLTDGIPVEAPIVIEASELIEVLEAVVIEQFKSKLLKRFNQF
jgi:Large polyvalent protein associated domain 29